VQNSPAISLGFLGQGDEVSMGHEGNGTKVPKLAVRAMHSMMDYLGMRHAYAESLGQTHMLSMEISGATQPLKATVLLGSGFPAIRLSASFTARRAAVIPEPVLETGPSESVFARNTRSMGALATG